MILILGKSTIAKKLESALPDTIVVGKPEYDFSSRYECKRTCKGFYARCCYKHFCTWATG